MPCERLVCFASKQCTWSRQRRRARCRMTRLSAGRSADESASVPYFRSQFALDLISLLLRLLLPRYHVPLSGVGRVVRRPLDDGCSGVRVGVALRGQLAGVAVPDPRRGRRDAAGGGRELHFSRVGHRLRAVLPRQHRQVQGGPVRT